MKKLKVTIKLEMEIPDGWELVKNPAGGKVIQTKKGEYLDMTFLPMTTAELTEGTAWTNKYSDKFLNKVLDMVMSEEVKIKLEK